MKGARYKIIKITNNDVFHYQIHKRIWCFGWKYVPMQEDEYCIDGAGGATTMRFDSVESAENYLKGDEHETVKEIL